MSERERRTATNEAMFREVNERLEARVEVLAGDDVPFAVLCECADPECTDRIVLTPNVYDTIHSDPTQFVVVEGHEEADVEEVVARNERYLVVRKRGPAGAIASELA